MKVSKGGVTLADILDFYEDDFEGWMQSAEELEKAIAEAAKRG